LRSLLNQNKLDRVLVCDTWTGPDGNGLTIPLVVDPSRWFVMGDDDDVLDLGAVRLGSLMTASLKAGKTVVVPENEWRNAPSKFEYYLMLGTPHELFDAHPKTGAPATLFAPREESGGGSRDRESTRLNSSH